MYAILIEEQSHFYDQIIGVAASEGEAESILKHVQERLTKEGYCATYMNVQKIPEYGEDMVENARTFIKSMQD